MPNKGYKQTLNHKRNNAIAHTGKKRKPFTEETIQKMHLAQQRKPKKFNILKSLLIEEYIKNRKSTIQIAKEIGCSSTIILRRLIKFNIPRRTCKEILKGISKPIGFGKIISKKVKEMWSNPKLREERIKSIFNSFNVKPNKLEIKLSKLLSNYKFVGDGKIFIAGFVPDFINTNGQKKIIELFGDFWHRNTQKRDNFRINVFKKYGYQTLIIWEHELKDLNKLKRKILSFNKK